jgi:hypothetical protein
MQFLSSAMVSILCKFLADKKHTVKNIRILSSCLTMKFIKNERKHPAMAFNPDCLSPVTGRCHPEFKYLHFPKKNLALVISFYGL